MTTKNFRIDYIDPAGLGVFSSFITAWNVAYRKVYSNINKVDDKEFKAYIVEKYLKSAKLYEYLVKEVKAKQSADESDRQSKMDDIAEIVSYMKDNDVRGKERSKLQSRMAALNKQLNRGITFGGKELLKQITKYSEIVAQFPNIDRKKYPKKKKFYVKRLAEMKAEFAKNRRGCVNIHGESAKLGNRFFDLSRIDEGILFFKPENYKIEIELRFHVSKGVLPTLQALKAMVLDKSLPVTVTFDDDHFHFSFEEGKLTGKFFDTKAFYKTIKHVKDKDERKVLISNAHKEHEKRNFKDKIANRYAAIDMNPAGIGFVIVDRLDDSPEGNINVVCKKYFDFSDLIGNDISSDKRRYELSIAFRTMFNFMEHYKVCHLVVEDLTGLKNNLGNTYVNRLINNRWNRGFIKNLYTRRCNYLGIKIIPINPAYSSFIGNIIYDEYDPVGAAIEIARRGAVKFIKGHKWLPEFHKGFTTVITDRIGDGMDGDDLRMLLSATSWSAAWSAVKSSEKSVRRVDVNDFDHKAFVQNGNIKSKTTVLDFP